MSRWIITLGVVLSLVVASQASATPTASITSPADGQCIGGSWYQVSGTAATDIANDSAFSYTSQVVVAGNVIQSYTRDDGYQAHGGWLANIDTTNLPATFGLRLRVTDSSGTTEANRTVTPVYDRQAPFPAPAVKVTVVSSRQALVSWTGSRDYGCAGPNVRYSVGAEQAGGTLGLLFNQTGTAERLTDPVLSGGQTYTIRATAQDANGLSASGSGQQVTTPPHYQTVLAGRVSIAGQGGRAGINVGNGVWTGAGGLYQLVLGNGQTFSVQYGPCLVPFSGYCSPVQTVFDSVTTPVEVGTILVHNKTLQPQQ